MQMTDEHWCKMAKKGHPSPGFEPAPLEGSKKEMIFLSKALPLSHGGFYSEEYRIVFINQKNQESITDTCSLLK